MPDIVPVMNVVMNPAMMGAVLLSHAKHRQGGQTRNETRQIRLISNLLRGNLANQSTSKTRISWVQVQICPQLLHMLSSDLSNPWFPSKHRCNIGSYWGKRVYDSYAGWKRKDLGEM